MLDEPEYDFSAIELLVLAACETGVSDSLDIGIEGIAGLAQAKGARTVVHRYGKCRIQVPRR